MKNDGRRAPRVRAQAAGFTLVELMVVLVIIVLLSSLVVPSVASTLRRGGIKATGDRLCDLLDYSLMAAVTRHRSVVVNLDPSRGRCWVSTSTGSLPWLEEERKAETVVLEAMELPEGIELSVDLDRDDPMRLSSPQIWDTITFSSDGRSEDTAIELRNPQGERYLIEIVGATGEVHGAKAPS